MSLIIIYRMRRSALLIYLFCSIYFQYCSSSFCGVNGVPYSLEILSDGSPVLGCAQPTCIAEPVDDFDDSSFTANSIGQEDGFFRDGDRERKPFLQSFKPKAECPGSFSDSSCTKKNQWVGGIDFVDHPRQPLVLQCCTFDGLRFSQDVGVTTIASGEAVTGGEVIRDGRQISFDVIANVRKINDPDDPKQVYYEVTVRRMNCLPDPPELEVALDDDIEREIQRVLGNATNSAMKNLGHDGHPHMTQEKKMSNKRPYKRKPKTSSTDNIVSPIEGHDESDKKGRSEPFIGSFGATIFNPTPENQKNSYESKDFAEEYASVPPTRNTVPYTRRILTPRPRMATTTPAPIVQTEPPTTAAPALGIQPIPQLPQIPFPAPQNFFVPTFPQQQPALPGLPIHPLFGVAQAPQLAPLPAPSPFGLFAPPSSHPFAAPQYGISGTGGISAPSPSGFIGFPQMPAAGAPIGMFNPTPFIGEQPRPLPGYEHIQPGYQFFSQPSTDHGSPNGQQVPNQKLDRVVIEAPKRDNQINGEPANTGTPTNDVQTIPQNRELGNLYQPPPFAALGTTLYNFQATTG